MNNRIKCIAARLLSLALVLGLMPLAGAPTLASSGTAVFINEIHYDNTSTDTGEAIEVAGPAGTDLTGWSLVLYNGSNGASYNTTPLSGVIPDQQNGFGTLVFTYPTNGIQNGSPDGIALVGPGGAVAQFLSYEGSFTAVGGPADGMMSTDIGVTEGSSTPVGDSLQLAGTGSVYEDFTWNTHIPNTFGDVNTGQTFVPTGGGPTDPLINEFVFNHTGTDTHEYVEVFGDPSTDYSAFTVLELEGDSDGAGVIDGVFSVGTTDAAGFYLIGYFNNQIENGTVTLLLVEGFSGSAGNDLDTDNDGSLDVTPWTRIVDDVAVSDGGGSDQTYSSTVLAPFFDGNPFGAGGASRIPNGTDTDAVSDWVRNDFDGEGLPGFTGSPEYGEALNTPGATNEPVPEPVEVCGDPFTPIYTVQGSGSASPLDGLVVSVEGVVTGDFQGSDELEGFFVQDSAGDGDSATSDGIFVYAPGALDVAVGDLVRVRGTVEEYYDLTELTSVEMVLLCGAGGLVAPTPLDLPLDDLGDWEQYEGMLVTFPEALAATDHYDVHRYGEVIVSAEGRLDIPTDEVDPGPAADALQELNDRRQLLLDDGSSGQFPPAVPYIAADGTLRLGDTVTGLTGVLSYGYDSYRLQPTEPVEFTRNNPRIMAPDDVGGVVKVASFNLLNYWTTIDDGANDARGADSPAEFARQKAKTVAAILAMDVDIVGLQELENNGPTAIGDLVDALNAATAPGTWAAVPDPDYPGGLESTNAIKVGIIYRADRVAPIGDPVADDDSIFATDRPPIAQTFDASGEVFTVVVNHLKSKTCTDATGLDLDQGDGQSCYNYRRTLQAQALLDFVVTLQTASGDDDVLVVGDLNSYAQEDPIVTLENGLVNQVDAFVAPEDQYSYAYFGQAGLLDWVFTTDRLADRVTGVDVWHINADEPRVLDYNDEVIDPAEYYGDFSHDYLYNPDVFRSSDHDPVIVGFCEAVPPDLEVSVSPDTLWPPNHKYVTVQVTVNATDNLDPSPAVTLVSVTSNEPDDGLGDGDTPDDIVIVDEFTFELRAERSGTGDGRVYTITYQATDACGNSTVATATVTVPHSKGGKK